MRARLHIVSLTAASLVALFSLGARARESGQSHPGGNACRKDMEKLCADVKPEAEPRFAA